MLFRWSRKRTVWALVITSALTALALVVGMNFATPEKELKRKIEHRYRVADPQFRREMGVLMGPAILSGNRASDLQNGAEIFPAMLEAIAGARQTITFETYIYWSGEVGQRFAAALAERARAGIRVNVIIDWAGSIKMDQAMLDQLTEAGVKLERYRPLRWYNLGRMNNRTHRKLLVVDGRVGFTGGVGIADQWLGTAQDPEHWRDMHFRIEGPVVAQFQAAFNDNWVRTTGEVLNGAEYFPQLKPLGDLDAHLFISSQAGGSDSMHLMYLMSIAAAARTLDLAASYFVPDALINKALVAARHREVRVRILLPGEHMDLATVQLASRENWGELLKAGVEIYQYRPTMLHTKLLIVDREMVSVGSTNFDIRSFRLNDEASLNVYDRAFAERMTAVFERDLRQASAYSYQAWSGRPWTERFLEKFVLPLKSQL